MVHWQGCKPQNSYRLWYPQSSLQQQSLSSSFQDVSENIMQFNKYKLTDSLFQSLSGSRSFCKSFIYSFHFTHECFLKPHP